MFVFYLERIFSLGVDAIVGRGGVSEILICNGFQV